MRDTKTGIRGVLYIAKCGCSEKPWELNTYSAELANDLESTIKWLQKEEAGSSDEVMELKQRFQEKNDQGYPIRLGIVMAGTPSEELKAKAASPIVSRNIDTDKVAFELFDIKRLHNLYIERLETIDIPIPPEVTFRVLENSKAVRPAKTGKALVCEVPLDEVYNLVNRYGLNLFAKNLRVPIVSSSYNKGMKRVLEDKRDRAKFWYYNNGITAVCDQFEPSNENNNSDELSKIKAEKMQIVNGCQTCFTVYYTVKQQENPEAFKKQLTKSTVLMRLISTGSGDRESSSFAHKIARYTNSQTPITGRDLRATDPEQGRMKEAFSQWKYFFEVKKDEFKRRKEVDASFVKRFEKPFYFTNEKAGQTFVAFWQNEPAFAKGSKAQIFENDERYESIFGPDIIPEAILLPAQLSYLQEEWRSQAGYKKRGVSKNNKLGVASLSKNEVIRHGELYILSIVGASLKKAWKVNQPSEMSKVALKPCCTNLKEIIKYSTKLGRSDGLYPLYKSINDTFEGALGILYNYSKKQLEGNPEDNLRNLLVRSSTWEDLMNKSSKDIFELSKDLAPAIKSIQ